MRVYVLFFACAAVCMAAPWRCSVRTMTEAMTLFDSCKQHGISVTLAPDSVETVELAAPPRWIESLTIVGPPDRSATLRLLGSWTCITDALYMENVAVEAAPHLLDASAFKTVGESVQFTGLVTAATFWRCNFTHVRVNMEKAASAVFNENEVQGYASDTPFFSSNTKAAILRHNRVTRIGDSDTPIDGDWIAFVWPGGYF